jgi:pilus assembly protein CpaD
MSEVLLNEVTGTRTRRFCRIAGQVAILAAIALATGCAQRQSIIVGSIPDDYRTNHPIVIAERQKTIDIPVGMSDSGLSRVQKVAVDGFMADYDRATSPLVTVLVPSGSGNSAAASYVAADMVSRMHAAGVPQGHILHQPYDASSYGASAPIRLAYAEMTASTGPCGRWPEDLTESAGEKHWANFGCSYQNNLAAQIANPADLLGPRKLGEIDAANRSAAIDLYRERGVSDEFFGNSEVNY